MGRSLLSAILIFLLAVLLAAAVTAWAISDSKRGDSLSQPGGA